LSGNFQLQIIMLSSGSCDRGSHRERGRTLIWRDDEGGEINRCADALW
jgi:hypothetical protein